MSLAPHFALPSADHRVNGGFFIDVPVDFAAHVFVFAVLDRLVREELPARVQVSWGFVCHETGVGRRMVDEDLVQGICLDVRKME
jgi:hypothetical protein